MAFVLHVCLVKRHGVTPRWGLDETSLARATVPYWPFQAARDAAACGVTFVVLGLIVIRTHGAALDGPADPSATYEARPEWYALPLYELRRIFEGSVETTATIALPGLAALLVAALPWLDGGRSRNPLRRKLVIGCAALGVGLLAWLGYIPLRQDARDPSHQRAVAEAAERARFARDLAQKGVPPEGGIAVYRNDPAFHARELWAEHCNRCHAFSGHGGKEAPDLKNYDSRGWIEGFLRNPDGANYMAGVKIEHRMKPVSGNEDELRALTSWSMPRPAPPTSIPCSSSKRDLCSRRRTATPVMSSTGSRAAPAPT